MAFVIAGNVEGEGAISFCFRTPLVLRVIFQHLPDEDLWRLRSFSEIWNYEAGCVLRDREIITRDLVPYQPCDGLQELAEEVHGMESPPFKGISILLDGSTHNCVGRGLGGPMYLTHFNRVQFKHLSLTLNMQWTLFRDCPAILLAKRILREHGGQLERLTFQVDYERNEFVQEFLEGCNFARLYSIHFGERNPDDPSQGLLQALLNRAPRLEELQPLSVIDLTEDLLHDSRAALVLDIPLDPLKDAICSRMIDKIRCKRITLEVLRGNFSTMMGRLTRVTPSLLRSSIAILRIMEVDVMFLAPLVRYGIIMENVVDLKIFVNIEELTRYPATKNFVKSINFSQMYPRLGHVEGVPSNHGAALWASEVSRIFTPALLPPSEPNRAAQIISVTLAPAMDHSAVNFLAEMFPDVQKICMDSVDGVNIPFDVLWHNSWVNILEISVRMIGMDQLGSVFNLDRQFCGLYQTEVDKLQQLTDSVLSTLPLVQKPSICCVKRLRTFNLFYGLHSTFRGAVNHPSTLFSKVTGLLAFNRCPGLNVNLETDDYGLFEALAHLHPYASVSFQSQRNGDDDHGDDDDDDLDGE